MMRYLSLLLLLSLASCNSSNVKEFQSPDGKVVKSVKCSKAAIKCYKKATNACGGTYQVVDSESHAGGLLSDAIPGPITWYGMSFICGASDGRLPDFAFQGQEYIPPANPAPKRIELKDPYENAQTVEPVELEKITNCTSRKNGNTVNTTCY